MILYTEARTGPAAVALALSSPRLSRWRSVVLPHITNEREAQQVPQGEEALA